MLPNVAAGQAVSIETVSHPAGYDSASRTLTYDGDVQAVMLTLSALGDVSGRVYSWDGQTPVAGATVRLTGGVADLGTVTTRADGSFTFAAVAANQSLRVIAEAVQDGVNRTGFVDARTPTGGGPVANLAIIMRQQPRCREHRRRQRRAGSPGPLLAD